ncbi:MAG: hypothetical protein KAR00_02975 [Candidatus Pacebacteria bacterium]|nr:hypothetical protein [Candidatus Paceibacterota bacterium]
MKKNIALFAILGAPVIAFAQNLSNVQTLVQAIGSIVDLLIPIAFAAALLFFFWGLAMYLLAGGNEEAQTKGKTMMLWGVIALFVMASIWGIVAFINQALGIQETTSVTVPSVQ